MIGSPMVVNNNRPLNSVNDVKGFIDAKISVQNRKTAVYQNQLEIFHFQSCHENIYCLCVFSFFQRDGRSRLKFAPIAHYMCQFDHQSINYPSGQ